MTAIDVRPSPADLDPTPANEPPRSAFLGAAAIASAGAGLIHVAAAGAHGEHASTAIAFAALAALQLGWAGLAWFRRGPAIAWVGAGLGVAAFAGWVLAKTSGLSFIAGLEQPEAVQWADATAAGLALLAFAAAAVAGLTGAALVASASKNRAPLGLMGMAVSLIVLPTIAVTGAHVHGTDHASEGSTLETGTPAAAVPPRPYDPNLPIDFGGVDGVSLEQQARAENLVAVTLARLPQFSDPATAVAAGYRSIGDGSTGYEHFVLWGSIDDNHILNPDIPESLVYRVNGAQRTLVAAMYMLTTADTLETVPDVGGRLTQWHVHDNLCYTPDPDQPLVRGLTDALGRCAPPLVKGREVPMIHVWIVPHPCGPFAALEGVGAGQINPGEQRWCDHQHGAT